MAHNFATDSICTKCGMTLSDSQMNPDYECRSDESMQAERDAEAAEAKRVAEAAQARHDAEQEALRQREAKEAEYQKLVEASRPKRRSEDTSKDHIPYCYQCRCYVSPNVVSVQKSAPGVAVNVGEGFIFSQRSSSKLVKLCPTCGGPVWSYLDEVASWRPPPQKSEPLSKRNKIIVGVLLGFFVLYLLAFLVNLANS